jgi:hypothetical protein
MNVFISYRRDDTKDFAGRLYDRLREEPRIKKIFLDVDGIDKGADFKTKIESAMSECEQALLLIGANWCADGRIKQEGDFVRLEAQEAMRGRTKVLPVLVNGAAMPKPSDLPPELVQLAAINALSARYDSFDRDSDFLVDVLLSRKKPQGIDRYWFLHPLQYGVYRLVVGALATALLLVVGLAIYNGVTGRSLSDLLGGDVNAAMLVSGALVLAGGLLSLVVFRRRRRRTLN